MEQQSGFFPFTLARYRKALGAAAGAFLATFPVVSYIGGVSMGDPKGLAIAGLNAAGAAALAVLFPKNEG